MKAMNEAMKEIEESKQNMSDNVPRPNQRAAEDEAGGMRKSMWWRSGRERKPFSFVV